jgi:DNA processing protein
LPGSIHAPLSKGCHRLIKDGAKLVEAAADILEELRMQPGTPTLPAPVAVSPEQHVLLDAMGFSPVSVDQIAQATRRGIAEVTARLSELEIAGAVASTSGGRFQRLAERVIE